jgi:hypothetical protein
MRLASHLRHLLIPGITRIGNCHFWTDLFNRLIARIL